MLYQIYEAQRALIEPFADMADAAAKLYGNPHTLLGQVPLVPALREGGDAGRPITVIEPEGEASQVFTELARRVDEELAPTKRTHPELKLL